MDTPHIDPFVPLDALLGLLPSLPRPVLSRLTARMIDRLDELDGDNDVELNGDEADGDHRSEDEFMLHDNSFGHPGCPIADPDFGADDTGEPDDCDEGFAYLTAYRWQKHPDMALIKRELRIKRQQ